MMHTIESYLRIKFSWNCLDSSANRKSSISNVLSGLVLKKIGSAFVIGRATDLMQRWLIATIKQRHSNEKIKNQQQKQRKGMNVKRVQGDCDEVRQSS